MIKQFSKRAKYTKFRYCLAKEKNYNRIFFFKSEKIYILILFKYWPIYFLLLYVMINRKKVKSISPNSFSICNKLNRFLNKCFQSIIIKLL